MKNVPDVKDLLEIPSNPRANPRASYQVPALEDLGWWQYATGFTFKVGSILPGQDGGIWGPRPWSLEEENHR